MPLRRRPFGFALFAVLAACFALVMMQVLFLNDFMSSIRGWALRGSVALLGALALVAAEALWRVQPWAFRATLAFALGFAAAVVTLSLVSTADPVEGATGAALVLIFGAMFIVPIVLYVRERSQTLFPPRRGVPVRP